MLTYAKGISSLELIACLKPQSSLKRLSNSTIKTQTSSLDSVFFILRRKNTKRLLKNFNSFYLEIQRMKGLNTILHCATPRLEGMTIRLKSLIRFLRIRLCITTLLFKEHTYLKRWEGLTNLLKS